MPLDDLNKDLYDPNSEVEERKHEESKFDPDVSSDAEAEIFRDEKSWGRKLESLNRKKIIKVTTILMGIAFVFLLALFLIVKFKETSFDENNVSIEIEGPAEVESAQVVTYKVKYTNNNRASLKNVEINLNYSENFKPEGNSGFEFEGKGSSKIIVGKINAYSHGEIEFRGRFYAPKDYVVYMKGELSFTPSNFNSIFKVSNRLGVNIKTSPVSLSVSAPKEALSGDMIEYAISYKNQSPIAFDDLRLEIEYPDGFTFKEANPYPIERENFWYLGKVEAGEERVIIVGGILVGERDNAKVISVSLGNLDEKGDLVVYSKKEESIKIVASPLVISHTVADREVRHNADLGEFLNYKIEYENEGEVGLRDVIIAFNIDNPVLDFSEIRSEKGGFYDSSLKSMIWKVADIPQLANLDPGQGGEINVTVPIKKKIDIENSESENFLIETFAEIDSPDVVLPSLGSSKARSNRVAVKINSKVILEVEGYHKDKNITNSGPMPPVVGSETTIALHWLITNISNDISGVRVAAHLPTGVIWKDKIYPEGENIRFNPRTNEVVWDVGDIKNGTGVLNSPREVSFQIGLIPSVNQVGERAIILDESVLSGKDLFTEENIDIRTKRKMSDLYEDESLEQGVYNIVATEE